MDGAPISGQQIVCVLGPARSGTSLATRLLALLGVYLGPDEHIHQAWNFNEKGSWEHRFIWELDREIVTRLVGPDWMLSLPPLPTRWADRPEWVDLKRRARAIVEQDFSTRSLWGWKHPETCLTLPFWQSILPTMSYVVCMREPAEVAASTAEKLGCTIEQGLYLWLRFLLSAWKHTEADERLLVFYEDWFRDPSGQLESMARLIGRPERARAAELRTVAEELIDENLWKHRTSETATGSAEEPNPQAGLLDVVQPLYDHLRSGGHRDVDLIDRFERACDLIGPEAARSEAARQAEYKAWLRELRKVRRELEELIPAGEIFALVDDGTFPLELFQIWRVVPFLGRQGTYWGSPHNSHEAISELERLRQDGVGFVVVGWDAFWWLEYYSDFHDHLRASSEPILENRRAVVFDLRGST